MLPRKPSNVTVTGITHDGATINADPYESGGGSSSATLRVYNGDIKVAEGQLPLQLIQLEPETTYNLKASWYDEATSGKESAKVDVPEFTTEVAPEEPVIATSMSVLPDLRECNVGDWRNFVITFQPENTTDVSITWETDETGLEYMPVPNDMYLRFRGLKVGTFDVTVTSNSNPSLSKTVQFKVN